MDGIKGEVTKASAVIALISPAYLASPFCMAELGAAWALGTHRFPIVVPPSTFADINATQLGLTAVDLSNNDALDQMLEDLNEAVETPAPRSGVRRRALKTFSEAWPLLAETIGVPDSVKKHVHDNALEKIEKLEADLEEADAEIRQKDVQLARMRTAITAADVEEIDSEFAEDDSLEDQFTELIEAVIHLSDELGGPAVLYHAIMDHYGIPNTIDWDNDWEEFEGAMQQQIFDNDSKELIWSAPELKRLIANLHALDNFLIENADEPFITDNDRRGLNDRRFWQKRI